MKDSELQLALAKMLPEVIEIVNPDNPVWFIWAVKGGVEIKNTEWLHICLLVRFKYELPVLVGSNEPWQEQARHILRHIKARDIILEARGL